MSKEFKIEIEKDVEGLCEYLKQNGWVVRSVEVDAEALEEPKACLWLPKKFAVGWLVMERHGSMQWIPLTWWARVLKVMLFWKYRTRTRS